MNVPAGKSVRVEDIEENNDDPDDSGIHGENMEISVPKDTVKKSRGKKMNVPFGENNCEKNRKWHSKKLVKMKLYQKI